MEWLSHSQKKYCELCKTPFRFTKLYHPQMPSSIPTTLFVQRALIHVSSWLLVWARAALVGSVWLVALPYTMRVVWRGLFWLADGGWARDRQIHEMMTRNNGSVVVSQAGSAVTHVVGHNNASFYAALPEFLRAASRPLNTATGNPSFLTLLSSFLNLGATADVNATSSQEEQALMVRRMDSLLSDVSVLQHLTKWPAVNRATIDILEGLIISLSVVVAFILVFLIREWVVQQQPLLNMHVEENNPAAAVQEQVAEVENINEEVERDDDNHEVVEQNGEEDDIQQGNVGASNSKELVDHELISAQQRAEATISLLPPDVQRAVRRGRLQDVVQNIKDLPPDEATRVKRLVLEWSRARKEHLEVDAASNESNNKNDIQSIGTDSGRPPLVKDRSALAYDVNRGMEEDRVPSPAHADQPHESFSHQGSEVLDQPRGPQEAVPESWDDAPTIAAAAVQSLPSVDGSSRSETRLSEAPQFSYRDFVSNAQSNGVEPGTSGQPIALTASALAQHSDRSNVRASDNGAATDQEHAKALAQSIAPSMDSRVRSERGTHGSNLSTADYQSHRDDREVSPTFQTTAPSVSRANTASLDPSNSAIPVATPAANTTVAPASVADRVLDYIYGDLHLAVSPVIDPGEDDEHIVEDIAEEAPFVPFADNEPAFGDEGAADGDEAHLIGELGGNEDFDPANDAEHVDGEAAEAMDGNNQDVVDDGEDLEGILELIGMQGPITGLLQNALFSAVLISISISVVVWLPYCGGKLILLMIRTPFGAWFEVPIQVVSAVENILTDAALVMFAGLFYLSTAGVKFLYSVTMGMGLHSLDAVLRPSKNIASAALERLGNATLAASTVADVEGHEYLYASMAAHASLKGIEQDINATLALVASAIVNIVTIARTSSLIDASSLLANSLANGTMLLIQQLAAIRVTLPNIVVWDAPEATSMASHGTLSSTSRLVLDPALAFWSARDRALTAGLSYLFLALVGCLYLSLSPPLFRSGRIRQVEQHITDILDQAGGVVKVILIITIEMISFPLFCGFLLDMALLPLFENASVATRTAFTLNRPWTSGFVHWFVGTCYMFHFALFVSMCRKIMRPGVLYFIRDPDDPTFHPVRDVLERSVATQLRKIAFSAIVYGALISVCLGGVVWGLWVIVPGVLPLHWSSSKSALEFPLDILFYNFLTPLVLRYAKPSDGLHTMYKWWFRRCARFLRLSDFLFGERLTDEEGYHADQSYFASSLRFLTLELPPSSKTDTTSGINKADLGVHDARSHKRQSLITGNVTQNQALDFNKTGRYVRAPATDQVRIPKGQPVFIAVTEDNRRLDGNSEDEGIHASDSNQTKFVYIPPWFALRISSFVITIWLFAAVTGCGITVVPLVAGRWMITMVGNAVSTDFLNDDTKVNDIYAFSLGAYTLGGIIYLALHSKLAYTWASDQAQFLVRSISTPAVSDTFLAAGRRIAQAVRLFYVGCLLLLVLPLTLATVLELYLLMPLHTLSTDIEKTVTSKVGPTKHTIHLVQDWTLGLLLSRIVVKLIIQAPNSLLHRAYREVIAKRGAWNPSARLATRYFVLPFSLLAAVVIAGPFALAQVFNKTVYAADPEVVKILMSRLVYPLCSGAVAAVYAGMALARATERWRGRIRDEIYLIGERLHNFGERKAAPPKPASSGKGKERAADVPFTELEL